MEIISFLWMKMPIFQEEYQIWEEVNPLVEEDNQGSMVCNDKKANFGNYIVE